MQQETYYDLLELGSNADLEEMHSAYLRISQSLASSNSSLGKTKAAVRNNLVKQAYEVLSNPTRRADYDAGLVLHGGEAAVEKPLYIEVGLKPERANPFRLLLTVIASVMVIGLILQVGVMFISYQRAKAVIGENGTSPAAEKIYLQDFYQTYGMRAASREEAELLLAEMRRKEQIARDETQNKQLQEDQERKLRQFEEESRRIGAEVSANLRRAELEAARQKEEELRQKEAKEQAEKAAERARFESVNDRLRMRSQQYAE